MIGPEKQASFDWISDHHQDLSDWNQIIWNYAEPAFREYKSAAWYVDRLRREGFEVEEASGGMPTAFCATWGEGGPTLAAYAEYDAVPGNCQAATARQEPRAGQSKYAPGHTDPHSALGIGALGGILAAKAAMEKHGLAGRIRFFGEPAEKLIASKPIHAAKGYYNGIDAAISYHPAYMLPYFNTTRWDTHCGAGFTRVYVFECAEPETWMQSEDGSPIAASHASTRAPGATDAVVFMYTMSKMMKEHMIDATEPWSMNEFIMSAGQATADNLPAHIGMIQYVCRTPSIGHTERILKVLDNTAEQAAKAAHCTWRGIWVARTRPGLPNHAMARLTYENLAAAGTPQFDDAAKDFAREIQQGLGLEAMDDPFAPECSDLIDPEEAEARIRQTIPPSITHFTSDDYVEYTWAAPTVRLYIGRPSLRSPAPGFRYPDWVMNALGGHPAAIDPMIMSAARTIAGTLIDLLTKPETLAAAQAEFNERTGGGVTGDKWIAPLLPADIEPAIDLPWPEYVTTARGADKWGL